MCRCIIEPIKQRINVAEAAVAAGRKKAGVLRKWQVGAAAGCGWARRGAAWPARAAERSSRGGGRKEAGPRGGRAERRGGARAEEGL